MATSSFELTSLQTEVLAAFFKIENRFFLTGGGALVGFYLAHRVTEDLDLFTLEAEAFEAGKRALRHVAEEVGAEPLIRQESPGFIRFFLARGEESVVVDLVLERTPQLSETKVWQDGIRLDPLEEIFANKLCTLVGRAEIRDVIDVMVLENRGLSLESGLEAALEKDGGATPASLAWVLSQLFVPDQAELPGLVDAHQLRSYVEDLIQRLRHLAQPGSSNSVERLGG